LAHRDRLCCSVRGIENGNFFFEEFEIGLASLGHKHQRRMKSINPIIHWNKWIPTNWINYCFYYCVLSIVVIKGQGA
jgi:hypothetical protein